MTPEIMARIKEYRLETLRIVEKEVAEMNARVKYVRELVSGEIE